MMAATSYQSPLAHNRLAFENELGSGSEYADNDASAQQIVYPMYAGVGSSDLDLGTSATMPSIQAEVQAKFGIYSTGDADFADIIEDVVKSGIAQAAVGAASTGTAYTQIEHGVSARLFPGCVQKKTASLFEYTLSTISFDQPNTAGNFLLLLMHVALSPPASPATATDTLGNTWTQLATGVVGGATWTLLAVEGCAAGSNTVTIANTGYYGTTAVLLEVAGVDTVDDVTVASGLAPEASLTTTNQQGFAEMLLALEVGINAPNPGLLARWTQVVAAFGADDLSGNSAVLQLNVRTPATYSIAGTTALGSQAGAICLVGLKATTPAPYPMPLPDFLDKPSLDLVRQQCRANGLWGSLTMNAQQAASDWLKTLYAAANAAPCFEGFRLYSRPYSEVSAIGNGALYTSPTAAGPVANLSVANGDILTQSSNTPPVQAKTKARVDLPNVLQMQCVSRTSNYNQIVVSQPDAAAIALYGVRKADPIVNNVVQDAAIARQLLGIAVRRNQYGGDVYSFSASPKWDMLSLMDLITVTDLLAGIDQVPVRITSIGERDDGGIDCEAEPFIYGMCSPSALPVTVQPQTPPNTGADPGAPNAPIIFEAVPRLYNAQNTPMLFIAVSGASALFAGALIFLSTDGGASYDSIGQTVGNAVTGVTTADWPAATNPDTTNDLALDLTESLGALESYATSDEDNFKYPCYVSGGGGSTIPYELMTYATATLTAANKYTLKATGSGNHLNRAVFAAPAVSGAGCDHPSASRFLFIDPAKTGILAIPLQLQWVGVTLYIKAVPFNSFGNPGQQTLEGATAYSFTPAGGSGSVNPTGAPVQGFLINGT